MSTPNFVETVIMNNFHEAQRYYPRLSKYLMGLLAGDVKEFPLSRCQIVNYYNAKHFLYHLCVIVEMQDDYIQAFDYFVSKLTNEELKNKNYLDFEDGYVYDCQMNQNYFALKLQDASFTFYEFFKELEQISEDFNYDIFRTSVMKILNNQISTVNMESRMQSNEYVEMCFMHALLKVLNDTKHLDEIINNCSN